VRQNTAHCDFLNNTIKFLHFLLKDTRRGRCNRPEKHNVTRGTCLQNAKSQHNYYKKPKNSLRYIQYPRFKLSHIPFLLGAL